MSVFIIAEAGVNHNGSLELAKKLALAAIEMCKVVAEYDGVFVIHQRSEADTILDSMREVIEIGRQSGVKVHWSHFKVCGKQNWDKIDAVLALLDEAKAEGITVSFDQYPYVAGSTMMGAILPPWVHDGGTDKAVARLADPELRKKMVHDMENGIPVDETVWQAILDLPDAPNSTSGSWL